MSFQGDSSHRFVDARLAPEVQQHLKSFAEEQGVPLPAVLVAAWQVFLRRITGRAGLAIAMLVSGGPFDAMSGDIQLITDETAFEEDRKFGHYVRSFWSANRTSFHIDERATPGPAETHPAASSTPYGILFGERDLAAPGYRMLLECDTTGTGIGTTLLYDLQEISPTSAEGMLSRYHRLLRDGMEHPDLGINDLGVSEMDATGTGDAPQQEPEAAGRLFPAVYRLFEAQAERIPDTAAIRCGEATLSYRELNARANSLARYLRKEGVRPGVIVGIGLPRSTEAVVAMIAVHKAGGGYIPLDPAFPADRIIYQLGDAGAMHFLTTSGIAGKWPSMEPRVICVDAEADAIMRESDDNLPRYGSPDDLALIMYTSGSTGKPKGVMISHRSLGQKVEGLRDLIGITENDVVLHSASFTFVLSVRQLFLPLCQGASLVLATAAEARDPEVLLALIQSNGITVIDAVPSFLRACAMWLEAQSESRRATILRGIRLRQVASVGEQLTGEIVRHWRGLLGEGLRFLNGYGQTETLGTSVIEEIGSTAGGAAPDVSIGRPIRNMGFRVLGENGQPVPDGTLGELYLTGDGIASGYRNLAGLTEEKFLTGIPGVALRERGYRTGDVVRLRPDGKIQYIGRADYQVKIRGFRIEPGEIESALVAHPAIRECVVAARNDARGEMRLVAYVVLLPGQHATIRDLRVFLELSLPEYMMPAQFVTLHELPRTPNGKLDRKMLPDPPAAGGASAGQSDRAAEPPNVVTGLVERGSAFMAPRTPTEHALVRLWEKHLNTSPIGIADNFFELGGNSLAAVSLFVDVEKEFGKAIPLATLLEASTVEQLAVVIGRGSETHRWRSLIPIQPLGKRPPLFCAHGGGGNVLSFEALSRHLGVDQPLYGLQSKGLDGSAPFATVEEMAAHYLRDILEFQPEGPYLLEGMSFGGLVALEMAQQLSQQGKSVALLALLDTSPKGFQKTFGSESIRRRMELRLSEFLALERHEKRLFVQRRLGQYGRRMLGRPSDPVMPAPEGEGSKTERAITSVIEANRLASLKYVPRPYRGRLTIFWARQSFITATHRFRMGWNLLAPDALEMHIVPGTHTSMFEEPNVQVLAREINECIRRVIPVA